MPKLKTHSGTKDRFKVSKNGKITRRRATSNHFLQKKSASRKRTFFGTEKLASGNLKNIRRKLGV